jgi:cyclin D1/2/4, plant
LFPISLLLDPVGQQAGDARYVFEAKTIQRMELLVLSTLKWRMQAVTPLSYVDYFLHRLRGGAAPSRRAVLRSAELILCIARGEQRPGSSQFSPSGVFFLPSCKPHRRIPFRPVWRRCCYERVAGTHCLDFRPSEIALAVAATVAGEERAVDIDRAFTHRVHKVYACTCLSRRSR